MDENEWLAQRFEAHRPRMRAVAYRMLGSASEADDAVQETWLRLARADAEAVESLPAWLTTVVARVCLNMLRTRDRRREEPLDGQDTQQPGSPSTDPEQEALLADSVGLALLVVLDTLSPPERVAFVLHDLFDLPFEEIAPVVGRSAPAARQLASRARRRIRGAEPEPVGDRARQRRVVDAYLAAIRGGDFEALVRLLDPDVEIRADATAVPSRRATHLRGAELVARSAMASAGRARFTVPALVNGSVGLVMAPRGQLFLVLQFATEGERITGIDVIADPDRLRTVELAVID